MYRAAAAVKTHVQGREGRRSAGTRTTYKVDEPITHAYGRDAKCREGRRSDAIGSWIDLRRGRGYLHNSHASWICFGYFETRIKFRDWSDTLRKSMDWDDTAKRV